MWKMLCPTLSTWFAHSDQFLYCYMQKNAAIVFNPSAIDSSVNMTASLQRWSVHRFSHSYLMSFFVLHVSEPGISKLCTTLQLPSSRVWQPEGETLTSTSTNWTTPCKPCHSEPEDPVHYIVMCPTLSHAIMVTISDCNQIAQLRMLYQSESCKKRKLCVCKVATRKERFSTVCSLWVGHYGSYTNPALIM